MSKFPKICVLSSALALPFAALAEAPARDGGYGLGRPALPEEIAAWDQDIRPDGLGLPEGVGDVATGEEVFVAECASCHGDFGEGRDRWPVLAGGQGTLTREDPVKTIGSYWPYLSTAWDYIHRAMPYGNAASLSDDDTYAVTAYLLYLNNIVDGDFVLSKENFAEVAMPNADGFYPDDRAEAELPEFQREPCMENCKDNVEITMRAAVLDVTPEEDSADDAQTQSEPAEDTAVADEGAEAAADEGAEAAADEGVEGEADATALDPALVEAGAKVFKKCQACHQVGETAKNRVGPVLNNIVGAPIAEVEGFKYSKAFEAKRDEGLVWDEESLRAYLANPRAYIKGTRMAFAGLKKEDEMDAIIAFLKSHSQ